MQKLNEPTGKSPVSAMRVRSRLVLNAMVAGLVMAGIASVAYLVVDNAASRIDRVEEMLFPGVAGEV